MDDDLEIALLEVAFGAVCLVGFGVWGWIVASWIIVIIDKNLRDRVLGR